MSFIRTSSFDGSVHISSLFIQTVGPFYSTDEQIEKIISSVKNLENPKGERDIPRIEYISSDFIPKVGATKEIKPTLEVDIN